MENNIQLQQSRNTYLSGLEDTEQAKAGYSPTIHSSNESYLLRQFFAGMESIVGFHKYY